MLVEHEKTAVTESLIEKSNQTPDAHEPQNENESPDWVSSTDIPQLQTDIQSRNITKSESTTQAHGVLEPENNSNDITHYPKGTQNQNTTQPENMHDEEQNWFLTMVNCMASKGKNGFFNVVHLKVFIFFQMLKMIFKLILSIDAKNINWKKSLREVIDEGKSQKYNRTNATYFSLNLGRNFLF